MRHNLVDVKILHRNSLEKNGRERDSVCVCVRVDEQQSVCECVWMCRREWVRQRKRESQSYDRKPSITDIPFDSFAEFNTEKFWLNEIEHLRAAWHNG